MGDRSREEELDLPVLAPSSPTRKRKVLKHKRTARSCNQQALNAVIEKLPVLNFTSDSDDDLPVLDDRRDEDSADELPLLPLTRAATSSTGIDMGSDRDSHSSDEVRAKPSDLTPSQHLPFQSLGARNFAAWALHRAKDMGHFQRLIDVAAQGPIKLGSLCSGLEVFAMVALCLSAAWRDLAVSLPTLPVLDFVHEFSCELDDKKRALLRTRPGFPEPAKHLFADVADVASGRPSYCSITQGHVCPARPDVLMAGWSCKDLSGLKCHMQVPFGITGTGCSSTTL